jgi:hypothetical protein
MDLNELRTFNAKPVAREILKPVLRPDATRVRVYFGPYNIFGQAVCALSRLNDGQMQTCLLPGVAGTAFDETDADEDGPE